MKHFHVPQSKNFDFLHAEYVAKGRSIKQIASSRDAVSRGLKEAGIKVRSAHKAHGHLSQPAFGTRIRSGKVVIDRAEATVVEQVRALKISGQSLREIARTLEKMGVPTKNKAKRWHPELVKRILARNS